MNDPQLTWYVIEDSVVTPYEEYYAGAFRPNDTIEITFQVWNNRWGQENAADINNGKLAVYFSTFEDSALLGLCSVKIDNNDFTPLTVQAYRGRIDLGRVLSGKINSGASTATSNYVTITLRFGPITEGIKNTLKNLFLDIEYNN